MMINCWEFLLFLWLLWLHSNHEHFRLFYFPVMGTLVFHNIFKEPSPWQSMVKWDSGSPSWAISRSWSPLSHIPQLCQHVQTPSQSLLSALTNWWIKYSSSRQLLRDPERSRRSRNEHGRTQGPVLVAVFFNKGALSYYKAIQKKPARVGEFPKAGEALIEVRNHHICIPDNEGWERQKQASEGSQGADPLAKADQSGQAMEVKASRNYWWQTLGWQTFVGDAKAWLERGTFANLQQFSQPEVKQSAGFQMNVNFLAALVLSLRSCWARLTLLYAEERRWEKWLPSALKRPCCGRARCSITCKVYVGKHILCLYALSANVVAMAISLFQKVLMWSMIILILNRLVGATA